MRVVYFLLLYVCTGLISGDQENEQDAYRKRIIEQLTRIRTVLPYDDYHLVTRHIATDVYMYRSYRTVSVVFYPVMRDVTDARFSFQSEDLHLNNIGSCSPREVIVNLKHGAYPAVNPDGYAFPKDFIKPDMREEIHTIELLSDGSNVTYSLENPKPGNWYALIYIKWEDPRYQKVEQQGLVADCQTILYTDLQVKRDEEIELIDCNSGLTVEYDQLPAQFKCMSPDTFEPISLNVTIVKTSIYNQELYIRIQALSIPTEEDYLIYCAFDPRANNIQVINFQPNPSAWHYIQIDKVLGNLSRLADCESYYLRTDEDGYTNNTITDLMRDEKGRFFTFGYGLSTTDLHDATSIFNITSSEIKSLRFKVNQFLDIGGTLSISASLLMNLKYYMGYKRQFTNQSLLPFTQENRFYKVVVCMDIDHPSIPLEIGLCRYNFKLKRALFVLNSTDSDSIFSKTYIPFPESGMWYLTFRLFCDDTVCPCATDNNGTTYYVDTSPDKDVDVYDPIDGNSTTLGTSECNASIVLSITSTSCVYGKCHNQGSCQLNTFGGLVMSFCSCTGGYGGWVCSDSSRLDSRAYMLTSVLLLTLSNLAFLFSIYVAIIRLYYTEAMMYTFTMVFSTFYHACDAPNQVAFCIIRGNILQYGDFYCGIMSFWVTLLAMSIICDELKSSLQLTGAIIIALLTTWNMHSFTSFLIPVTAGIVILITSWIVNYRKNRRMKYPRQYYLRHLPIGLVVVSAGLITFAFLQTEANYSIIHTLWHVLVAVSIGFLLPDKRLDSNVSVFAPSKNYYKINYAKLVRRLKSPPPVVPPSLPPLEPPSLPPLEPLPQPPPEPRSEPPPELVVEPPLEPPPELVVEPQSESPPDPVVKPPLVKKD